MDISGRLRGGLWKSLCSGFILLNSPRWGWFRFVRCWMIPFPEKGYAGRKTCTGNRSVRFDEEVEDGRLLLYSTEGNRGLCIHRNILKNNNTGHKMGHVKNVRMQFGYLGLVTPCYSSCNLSIFLYCFDFLSS